MRTFVLGGAQTDFARNWGREEALDAMPSGVAAGTLENARLDASDIDVIHVGNFVGELFCGQSLLGALLSKVEPALAGKPASRHEAKVHPGRWRPSPRWPNWKPGVTTGLRPSKPARPAPE